MEKFKFKIPKSIILLFILSFILVMLRIIIFGKYSLIYLLWNIFLAFLPFMISSIMFNFANEKKLKTIIFFIFGIVWLLLIPNSPYIITDLIHIGEIRKVPLLFDSFLIFGSASLGLLLGMHSMYDMERIIKMKFKKNVNILMITIFAFIIGFGVFLGRFLRFNSWDVFASPVSILNGIKEIFSNRSETVESLLYTVLFSVFILVFYLAWKSESKRSRSDS
jgi:uncharacterized membrane protein